MQSNNMTAMIQQGGKRLTTLPRQITKIQSTTTTTSQPGPPPVKPGQKRVITQEHTFVPTSVSPASTATKPRSAPPIFKPAMIQSAQKLPESLEESDQPSPVSKPLSLKDTCNILNEPIKILSQDPEIAGELYQVRPSEEQINGVEQNPVGALSALTAVFGAKARQGNLLPSQAHGGAQIVGIVDATCRRAAQEQPEVFAEPEAPTQISPQQQAIAKQLEAINPSEKSAVEKIDKPEEQARQLSQEKTFNETQQQIALLAQQVHQKAQAAQEEILKEKQAQQDIIKALEQAELIEQKLAQELKVAREKEESSKEQWEKSQQEKQKATQEIDKIRQEQEEIFRKLTEMREREPRLEKEQIELQQEMEQLNNTAAQLEQIRAQERQRELEGSMELAPKKFPIMPTLPIVQEPSQLSETELKQIQRDLEKITIQEQARALQAQQLAPVGQKTVTTSPPTPPLPSSAQDIMLQQTGSPVETVLPKEIIPVVPPTKPTMVSEVMQGAPKPSVIEPAPRQTEIAEQEIERPAVTEPLLGTATIPEIPTAEQTIPTATGAAQPIFQSPGGIPTPESPPPPPQTEIPTSEVKTSVISIPIISEGAGKLPAEELEPLPILPPPAIIPVSESQQIAETALSESPIQKGVESPLTQPTQQLPELIPQQMQKPTFPVIPAKDVVPAREVTPPRSESVVTVIPPITQKPAVAISSKPSVTPTKPTPIPSIPARETVAQYPVSRPSGPISSTSIRPSEVGPQRVESPITQPRIIPYRPQDYGITPYYPPARETVYTPTSTTPATLPEYIPAVTYTQRPPVTPKPAVAQPTRVPSVTKPSATKIITQPVAKPPQPAKVRPVVPKRAAQPQPSNLFYIIGQIVTAISLIGLAIGLLRVLNRYIRLWG